MKRVALTLFLLSAGCVTPAERVQSASELPKLDNAIYVEADGAFLRVRDTGPKDGELLPVLLVHGYGSRLETWGFVQKQLSAERRVVSFDQRGFGMSERPAGAYGPAVHAADALRVMDELGIERAILMGHSYGGGVVTRVALHAPDRVAGLVLVDAFLLEEQLVPTFRWAKLPVVGELLFGAFYKEVPGEKYLLAFQDRERFVTVEALEEMKAIMAKPGSVYAALETVRGMDYAEVEPRYAEVDQPVLVVWGEEDRVTPLSQGHAIAGRFDARFAVLPASGHVPGWEAPRSLMREVRVFLSVVDGGAE